MNNYHALELILGVGEDGLTQLALLSLDGLTYYKIKILVEEKFEFWPEKDMRGKSMTLNSNFMVSK